MKLTKHHKMTKREIPPLKLVGMATGFEPRTNRLLSCIFRYPETPSNSGSNCIQNSQLGHSSGSQGQC